MGYLRKVICFILAIVVFINGYGLMEAMDVMVNGLPSMDDEDDKEGMELKDVLIDVDMVTGRRVLKMKKVGLGECVYQVNGVKSISIGFRHMLGTVAYKQENKEKNGSYYVLGSGKGKPYRVKYLPSNDKYGKLKDGLYINPEKKGWQKCIFSEEKYIFEELSNDLSERLDCYESDLIDYGINIYVSNDGEDFQRVATNVTIKKESLDYDSDEKDELGNLDINIDQYIERVEAKEISDDIKYIKIEINEVGSLMDSESGQEIEMDAMTIIDEINFVLDKIDLIKLQNRDGVIGKSDEMIKEGEELEKAEQEKEEIIYKKLEKRDKKEKKVKYIDDGEKIGISLGESRVDEREEDRDERIVYKRRKPNKKRRKKTRYVYLEDEETEDEIDKIKNRDEKIKTVAKKYKNKKKDEGMADGWKEDEEREDEERENEEETTGIKLKRKDKKRSKGKKKYIRHGEKEEENDKILIDKLKKQIKSDANLEENIIKDQDEEKSDQAEIVVKNIENQDEAEKTVSKLYLLGLLVSLGSVVTYDKIGLVKRFFKL